MNEELKKWVKAKIEELSFAHYEGMVEGVVIIVLEKGGAFKVMPAYDSNQAFAINAALDLAKNDLIQLIKSNNARKIK